MSYTVRVNTDGTYTIEKNGNAISDARVERISFPTIETHTIKGTVHHVTGSCLATISVPGDGTIKDVPVVI